MKLWRWWSNAVKFDGGDGFPLIVDDQSTITVELPFKLRDDLGGEASFMNKVIFKNEKGTLVLITPRAICRVQQ